METKTKIKSIVNVRKEILKSSTKTRKQPKEKFYDIETNEKVKLNDFYYGNLSKSLCDFALFPFVHGRSDDLERKGSSCTNELY